VRRRGGVGRVVMKIHRLLSHAEKARLRHLVEAVERETGAEIATLIVRHVDDVEAFATAYFNHLGIGKREHHNGVLILAVLDRRRVRIEVGRGLDRVLTRAAAQRIIDEAMAPAFRVGRYGEGLIQGVQAVGALIRAAHAGAGKA
ncbi:MAG TPA: TPM domain-containing protein, partial [bacterium]|nr:TPM domain-containing protein [bacterium]